MKNGPKIAIVVLLAVAVAATFVLRGGKRAEYVATSEPAASVPVARSASTQASSPVTVQEAVTTAEPEPSKLAAVPASRTVASVAKPRLLELGSMRCQACLEMAKVLDALRASQGAKLRVDFIDVFEKPEAADNYKIALIPTQILFDRSGKEIFRHQGFFSHDDILAKFRALGVEL